MLSAEENDRLTRVGAGTPTGELLRRYWMPVAVSSDLRLRPLKRKVLGEELVVFRDGSGRVGVVERHCAHRRADLAFAIVEADGIRCGYHGWKFDLTGRCIEQPAEPRLMPNARVKAYPAQELGGLVWTYMGPEPVPLLPRFEPLVWTDAIRDIGHAVVDCNWLQAQENSCDPHHVEWLHGHLLNFWLETGGSDVRTNFFTQKHKKIGFDDFAYGIIKRRVFEGRSEEDDDWKIGHPLVYPIALLVGGAGIYQMMMRTPIDDESHWHVWYSVFRPPGVEIPVQTSIPSYEVPLWDAQGERIVDFVDGQDVAMWSGQGPIADRTRESLATTDAGVVALRRLHKEQLERIARGEDPIGVVRDPAKNRAIALPIEMNKGGNKAKFAEEVWKHLAVRHSPIRDELVALFRRAAALGAAGSSTAKS